MLHINNDVLEFLQEAKEAFESDVRLETYRNKEETYIALRYGMDRDCIRIYELGDSVLQLNQAIPKEEDFKIESKDFDIAWSKILKKNGY